MKSYDTTEHALRAWSLSLPINILPYLGKMGSQLPWHFGILLLHVLTQQLLLTPPSPSRGLGPDRRAPLLPETTQTGSSMGCALVTGGWKTASSHLLLIQVPSTFQHGGCTLPSEALLSHGFPQVAVLGEGKISGTTSLPPTKISKSSSWWEGKTSSQWEVYVLSHRMGPCENLHSLGKCPHP